MEKGMQFAGRFKRLLFLTGDNVYARDVDCYARDREGTGRFAGATVQISTVAC
jgi:hypothetical protein